MNWNTLQTYGLSSEKSFEMLCNQLFENWCKEEYGTELFSFHIVNGAGGDGGVESYAELNDGSVVGLQAKWFISAINANQISQIRNSVQTAKKIRPNIRRYIVCVPRDIASLTGKGDNTESKKWDDLISEMKKTFPELVIELWNDTRITTEMQKPCSAGIQRFWFENSEISCERFEYSLNKSKSSWLSAKYVPDLNTSGTIRAHLINYVGDFDVRMAQATRLQSIINLCDRYFHAADELNIVCGEKSPDLRNILCDAKKKITAFKSECKKIHSRILDEYSPSITIDESVFRIHFESLARRIDECRLSLSYYSHFHDVTKVLNQLADIDYYTILDNLSESFDNQCRLFLGDPGTGKTQGVTAFADALIQQQYHIPIMIQARSVPEDYNWREIILHEIGLADVWDEEELWQALLSAANRNRFRDMILQEKLVVAPKVLIIVDGIDEAANYQKWISRIQETVSIIERYPQIRFCFTSRPIVFPKRVDFANVEKLNSSGDVPVYRLFDAYTRAYDITVQNCQWLKYALNTPLALKLFCELYKGQNVTLSQLSDVTMNQLWRKKIERIQNEYNLKEQLPDRNQLVFKAIVSLSSCFVETKPIERDDLINLISDKQRINTEAAEKLLYHLELYGIVGSFCEKGTGLSPDRHMYYPGIQGYFDYAAAMQLLEIFKHPSKIDFTKYSSINQNVLYSLAVISIQKYDYLLTRNATIEKAVNCYEFEELQFYALQHTPIETAEQFKKRSLEIMSENASGLITITNKLVLPLARIPQHPLGVSLLDEFLNKFEKPAQRDIVWSLPPYLRDSGGRSWEHYDPIGLLYDDNEEYALTSDDMFEGLPTVYAWMLSNVSNAVRRNCRDKLMKWARSVPNEYYKLFLHFADVNDPQIRSDLFSILMCLVYEGADDSLIKDVSDWILSNILVETRIDQNRDISIRYFSIAIIERAKRIGIYSEDEIKRYLPPYSINNLNIALNKDALAGDRMGGYSAITYDLARYVLVDHFEFDFNTPQIRRLDSLVKSFAEENTDYHDITSEQFIISAAYAFILQMGWNEEEFYNRNIDETGHYIGGVDFSIGASYYPADHGAQSEIMTVCEKYIWAARSYLSGFFCDRLLYGYEQIRVTDYSMLDKFVIPAQEIRQIDPDNLPEGRPWHIPEPQAVLIDKQLQSKEDIIEYIRIAPEINWAKWIEVGNEKQLYALPDSELLALYMYSCFYESAGIETNLFINSIVVKSDEVSEFLSMLRDKEIFNRVCTPSDWSGSGESSCYITPKEVCWFPWKKHYDSSYTDEFPELTVHSAVDDCTYYYPDLGEVHYSMPSMQLRILLGITDTDGYLYYDKLKNIIAEYSLSGERWRTSQHCLLVGKSHFLQILRENGFSLIWIMLEMRRETLNAQEMHGQFYAERKQYSIGYYNDNMEFTEEILKSSYTPKQ